MAAFCTKSIPEPCDTPRPSMAGFESSSQCVDHKMRSDIPKMCGAPLNKRDFKNLLSASKYFVDFLLAIYPFHTDFFTRG